MSEVNTLRPDRRSTGVQAVMINYIGYNRANNEDNCCINDFTIPLEQMNGNVSCATTERGQSHLFGVFDGVGGDARGEDASCCAARFFADHRDKVLGDCAHPERMATWFQAAHQAVRGAAGDSGTTATLLCLHGATARLANVGDSRAYFLHEGLLEPISQEHTWAAQMGGAPDGPGAHAILRYLGGSDEADGVHEPYCSPAIPLENGDIFLLCSDGLTDMVPDEELRRILLSQPDLQQAAPALVQAALEGGGADNITVLLLKVAFIEEPS
ncbi:MAG: PP2C family protein-serine/threonine phosphatase [Aristaeellaceae bacterium]